MCSHSLCLVWCPGQRSMYVYVCMYINLILHILRDAQTVTDPFFIIIDAKYVIESETRIYGFYEKVIYYENERAVANV
jgi:hypothetical protein